MNRECFNKHSVISQVWFNMHIYVLLLCLSVHHVWTREAPVVSTNQGPVRGLASDDGSYHMYLGIPYGLVNPLNPFADASPHPAFEGTFNAVNDTSVCPQIEEYNHTVTGSLDCLHLNVFVPSSKNTPKAILVWIYGGRFAIGSYSRYIYGPKFLVKHDIILVTINYRLGPYGFMCADSPLVPGNQGLKDQELALKWVKDNIANFGGDSNKITIDGNSSGSLSTDMHIVRNHEPRLFNQAILQSGTSLSPFFAFPENEAMIILAKHLGLETNDFYIALDFVIKTDPLRVIRACEDIGFQFRPCKENDFSFDGVVPFLGYNWMANDSLPLVKDMNIMIGFNNDEDLASFRDRNQNYVNSTRESLSGTFDVDHVDFSGEPIVNQFFFGDNNVNDHLQGAVEIRSDLSFIHASRRVTSRFLRNGVNKVYMYMFKYNGGRNFVKTRLNITQGGAIHADEIGYLFDVQYMEKPNVKDQLIIDRMTEMWANFVKYRDPTPQISSLLPVRWKPISSNYSYLEIGEQLVASYRPFNERMTFWDLFFEQYGHLQMFLLEDQRKAMGLPAKKLTCMTRLII